MTSATKKQAQEKLRATLNKIGYPDKWRDYSSVSIDPSSYSSIVNTPQASSSSAGSTKLAPRLTAPNGV